MHDVDRIFNDLRERIEDATKCNSDIYIFGTGHFGSALYEYLRYLNINPTAFITSKGGEDKYGLRVYSIDEARERLREDSLCFFGLLDSKQPQSDLTNVCAQFIFSEKEIRLIGARTIWIGDKYFHERGGHWLKEKDLSHCISGAVNNILVVQLETTYGDMIWSSAFFRELKNTYPKAKVYAVFNKAYSNLYANCPYIDTYYYLSTGKDVREYLNFTEDLYKSCQFDIVFCPKLLPNFYYDLFENVIIAVGSNARFRVGHLKAADGVDDYLAGYYKQYFNHVIVHKNVHHEVLQNLSLLDFQQEHEKRNIKMEIWTSEEDYILGRKALRQCIDKIKVFLGITSTEEKRTWHYRHYVEFIKILTKHYNNVVFILGGGTDAKMSASAIMEEVSNYCIDLTGKTSLLEVAALIDLSDVYIGSDTGLMHLAGAKQVPIIELCAFTEEHSPHKASSPERTGPWGTTCMIIRAKDETNGIESISADEVSACTLDFLKKIGRLTSA